MPSNPAMLPRPGTRRRSPWLGTALLVLSALAFSVSMISANMALGEGISVHTSNAARYLLSTALMLIVLRLAGRRLRLARRERLVGFGLGVPVFMTSFGYLAATQYIPVSLAVLIFYSSPILVALITRLVDKERFTWVKVLALAAAFSGLALALRVGPGVTLDLRGIGLALLAAMGAAALVTISSHAMRTADSQVLNLHGLSTAAVFFVIFAVFQENPSLPNNTSGWEKLFITGLALAAGYASLFGGVRIVGPMQASMLMNLEPLITIGMAISLLGEAFSPQQALGAALVLGGVFLLHYHSDGRRK